MIKEDRFLEIKKQKVLVEIYLYKIIVIYNCKNFVNLEL